MLFNGPVIPFGAMVEHHLFVRKISRNCLSSAQKYYQVFFSAIHCTRGDCKGDIMFADIEKLEEMDGSELHAGRLNAKEVFNATKKW